MTKHWPVPQKSAGNTFVHIPPYMLDFDYNRSYGANFKTAPIQIKKKIFYYVHVIHSKYMNIKFIGLYVKHYPHGHRLKLFLKFLFRSITLNIKLNPDGNTIKRVIFILLSCSSVAGSDVTSNKKTRHS